MGLKGAKEPVAELVFLQKELKKRYKGWSKMPNGKRKERN